MTFVCSFNALSKRDNSSSFLDNLLSVSNFQFNSISTCPLIVA